MPEKTADPPHRKTLTLSLLQLLITTTGILIAIWTLRQSNENFKVANKAYINLLLKNIAATQDDEFKMEFAVTNSGNTPAFDTKVFVAVINENNPTEFRIFKAMDIGALGPKADMPHAVALKIPKLPRTVGLEVYFRDVFGKSRYNGTCQSINEQKQVTGECDLRLAHNIMAIRGFAPD